MSCGCLAARRRRDWLNDFPLIALGTVCAALVTFFVYRLWGGLAIDVGGQTSPQEVFFGTEYRNRDVAQFVVPIEAVAAAFFVLVALMFVGLGQVLGRAFDAYPDRVFGYTLNIGGSLGGILAFTAMSFCQAPPFVWFAVELRWGGVFSAQKRGPDAIEGSNPRPADRRCGMGAGLGEPEAGNPMVAVLQAPSARADP